MELQYQKKIKLFLWAVAIHSLMVGLGLIFATNDVRILFGFKPSQEHFFQIQGGVFHIVMAIGYALPAYNPRRFYSLIVFTIIVKLFATIFLLIYYSTASANWLVLASGIIDFLICYIVFFLFRKYTRMNYLRGDTQ